ncbi:hypothetical protein [Pseudomonas oryzae]|uniref:Uncharacterized protein n=1 Tax=Pseudomonas oryzae TaxID=1392877 RepID=A0A1H1RUG7_9PSED|nr:hypothetical protein [Pseudomonas oryzae]SDS39340.1 hypothetical protein SAMN05216221_1720 [Pseudomonas oryzae]
MLEPDPDLFRVMAPVDSGRSSTAHGPETGQTGFPLFSDAPFVVWYHQHRKSRSQGHIHPTCLPPIRLWDEAEDHDRKS